MYRIFLKPYFIFCFGISLLVLFNVVFIVTGLIDMNSWPIPNWLSPGMVSRDEIYAHLGGTYKFPLYSTIVYSAFSAESLLNYQGIFGIGGQVIGLSFEPHIALAFLAPAFFLYDLYPLEKYKKGVIILIFAFMTLAAGSVTAFIIIPLLFVLIFFKKISDNGLIIYKSTFSYILIITLIIFISTYLYDDVINYAINRFSEFKYKETSGGKAFVRLIWLFTPKSLFGSGMFPNMQENWWFMSKDIGLIPMLTFALHFTLVAYFSLKLFFSKSKYAYFGLSCIYLLFHSLKIYTDLPQNQFYIFLLFLLCCHLNLNDREMEQQTLTL